MVEICPVDTPDAGACLPAAFVFAIIPPQWEVVFIIPKEFLHLISMCICHAALLLYQFYNIFWRNGVAIIMMFYNGAGSGVMYRIGLDKTRESEVHQCWQKA